MHRLFWPQSLFLSLISLGTFQSLGWVLNLFACHCCACSVSVRRPPSVVSCLPTFSSCPFSAQVSDSGLLLLFHLLLSGLPLLNWAVAVISWFGFAPVIRRGEGDRLLFISYFWSGYCWEFVWSTDCSYFLPPEIGTFIWNSFCAVII